MARKKKDATVVEKSYAEQRQELAGKREALQKEIADKRAAFEKQIAEQVALEKSLEEEQEALARKEQMEFIEFLRANKEVVLRLLSHGRTSCSDNQPVNGWGSRENGCRCNKCGLIEILNGDEQLPDNMKIDFEVNFYHR